VSVCNGATRMHIRSGSLGYGCGGPRSALCFGFWGACMTYLGH
jgi:hypothetical protein